MSTSLYDTIGTGYTRVRQPDSRIGAVVERALDGAGSVVNVGAGTGSYEPAGARVVAVDPSIVMVGQRPSGAAPAVLGDAVALPFRDRSFEASMAVLTTHHWPDRAAGLREMARVASGRVVILTWDPAACDFWLYDYLPQLVAADDGRFDPPARFADVLGPVTVTPVKIPHDCTDGFLAAYWRRPHAYLDPAVRAGISAFTRMEDPAPALERLRADIESGAWALRYPRVVSSDARDYGYRLVVARARP